MSIEVRRESLPPPIISEPKSSETPAEKTRIPEDYSEILKVSKQTLQEVIHEDRIEASGDGVYKGGDFTRDGAITAVFTLRAETLKQIHTGAEPELAPRIAKVLLKKIDQQSHVDIPNRGIKKGQMPHEVRTDPAYYQHLTHPRDGGVPFYYNPDTGFVENFDAADATGLWVYTVGKYVEGGQIQPNERVYDSLRHALDYCLGEIDSSGLVGYEYEGERKNAELRNKTWKDSDGAFLLPNGQLATVKDKKTYDIWTNGVAWAALEAGARVFAREDPEFSRRLFAKAGELKEKINSPVTEGGFMVHDEFTDTDYFAEALSEKYGPLTAPSADPALLLGLYVNGDSPIKEENVESVIQRVMKEDLYDPEAGIRTYSNLGKLYGIAYDHASGYYHRGPNTFWPWNSEMIAVGAEHFGYEAEATKIRKAMLKPLVDKFRRPIELYLRNERGNFVPYQNTSGQLSCFYQSWTAGAIYEAVQALYKAA